LRSTFSTRYVARNEESMISFINRKLELSDTYYGLIMVYIRSLFKQSDAEIVSFLVREISNL